MGYIDFSESTLRAEAKRLGYDFNTLLEMAGRALPDHLPTEPAELTDEQVNEGVQFIIGEPELPTRVIE